MSQPKVYEFAKEMGMETLVLMDKIKAWNLPIKSHMSALSDDQIEEIKDRLSGGSEANAEESTATKKKKVAKKKATKKAVAKKKTTTVVKKASETVSKKTTKKSTTAKTMVIRRKSASQKEKEAEEAAKAAAELAAAKLEMQMAKEAEVAESLNEPSVPSPEMDNIPAHSAMEAIDTEVVNTDSVEGVFDAVDESEEPIRKSPKGRGRNIVGRIDLAKVSTGGAKPSAPSAPRERESESPRRPVRTGARNIRTGFVAPMIPEPEPFMEDRRREEKVAKKVKGATGGGSTKEQPQVNFSASDFRKREVIFQPKKKRAMIKGEIKKVQLTTPAAHKRVVKMYETISLEELAHQMNVKVPQLTKVLIKNGVMATMNTPLDLETVTLIAPEFGFETETLHRTEEELVKDVAFGELEAERVERPPVVTVMGHVDHGKTTLLDSIRKANVVSSEAGGITQHIGAYEVKTESGHNLTFIDTPGHEAFTEMRARGANVTDIAIIVVAADDGVMPQSIEAINHAKAAGVPIIVAVNKMDKPQANPDRVKQQLMDHQIVPEEWGGDTMFCGVSAVTGDGIGDLLEQVYLLAEVQELKANPKRSATGIVIESRMEKGKGNVASLLVQDGTIKVGQLIVAGCVMGKVRSMHNDKGSTVKEVGPGRPVEITGLTDSPMAGDRFDICQNEKVAEQLVQYRRDLIKAEETPSSSMSLDQIFAKVKRGDLQELPLILKADVAGSIEAIKGSFDKVNTEEVKVKVIHSAVGGISESDVLLASTSGGLVVGFNVRPDVSAERIAKERGVEIKCYRIIYELLEDIKKAMSGLLRPEEIENSLGRAQVRDTFSVPKIGMIAGCMVTNGKLLRGSRMRVIRDGRQIYDGLNSSLKRFKDDAREVATGFECGVGIENFNDIKVGDEIEAYEIKQVAREL